MDSPDLGEATNANPNITDRNHAEFYQARLAAIVQSSDDAIVSKTLESIITTWNPAAERIFGYTAEEAIGKSITMLIPPESIDEEEMILSRIKRGERIEHYETVRVRKDGSRLDVSLTVSPIKDSSGQVMGASKSRGTSLNVSACSKRWKKRAAFWRCSIEPAH